MGRSEELQEKLSKWMNVMFDNIPDDIAVYVNIYIRDKSNNEDNRIKGQEDWEISMSTINKNCTYFDRAMVYQDIIEQYG